MENSSRDEITTDCSPLPTVEVGIFILLIRPVPQRMCTVPAQPEHLCSGLSSWLGLEQKLLEQHFPIG
eukprot:10207613-Ditylum_brightwellii.AAC.1